MLITNDQEPVTTIAEPPRRIVGLRPNQLSVYHHPARFRVVVAGRRFGKSQLALVEMLRAAATPNSRIWYVGPSYDQAKRILWDRLKAITRPHWAGKPSETELTVRMNTGSQISLRGTDRPDSIRGNGLDFAVMDEYASMHPSAWSKVLRPALSDRLGRALFLGTPQGSNHFYDLYKKALTDPDWGTFQYTTSQGGNVPPEELASAAIDLDPESFRQEFEAAFTSAAMNRVYYGFDPVSNVQAVQYDPYIPLVWSLDFNINPMCMLLMQRSDDTVYVLDEIIIKPDANTELACQAFHKRARALNPNRMQVEIYGDASGNQRRTSSVNTDWTIIKNFLGQFPTLYHPTFHLPKANPAVRDRINCVNTRLRNTAGDARLFVDPKCRELIKDLEQVSWALDANDRPSSNIDKSDGDRTHSSDALGYYVSEAFPMRGSVGPNASGRIV